MKRITLLFVLSFIGHLSIAQITEAENKLRATGTDTLLGWKKGGLVSLNFSQAAFNNWAAGGQNSLSLNTLASVFMNYKAKNYTWDNMLDVGYGLLQQGNAVFKTDDKIDFSSKYGKIATKDWYYAALLNFKTQMSPGYNYPDDSTKISDFMSPGYVLAAIGMDYKPNTHFTAFIAPITVKNTIVTSTVLSDIGAFGVDPAEFDGNGVLIHHGKMLRTEYGGYMRIVYKNTFFEDKSVTLLTKLDLFSNYLHNPENIDVSWETILGFRVNKYIVATITVNVLYDDDIDVFVDKNRDGIIDFTGPRTQLKEVLGIGFAYKF